MGDAAAAGLVEEEYFLEGDALRYELAPGATLSFDGRWEVQPAGRQRYKTRVLVRRPTSAESFNGTVIVTWMNVSAGWDWWDAESPELLEGGYAAVGVTCQRVGVHGQTEPSPQRPELGTPVPEGLHVWDPERYGTLTIDSDLLSYDIFSQAARLVGPGRPRQPRDLMGGLPVRRVVGYGMSQGANQLATYINAVQPRDRAFDGFLLERYVGSGFTLPNAGTSDPPVFIPEGSHLLRDDLDCRILVVNAESDASQYFPARQPDSDRFQLWEVAGASHVGMWSGQRFARRYAHEFDRPWPRLSSPENPNYVSLVPVVDAGYRALHSWLADGAPPPAPPRITIAGQPPRIQRDELGHAKGGVRLPEVEVPIARHIGVNIEGERGVMGLRGRSVPLTAAELKSRYGDSASYVAQFEESARRAVELGVLLRRDAEAMVAEARLQVI